jgi:hypothetical protein
MQIYLLDETEQFLKFIVVSGNPHNGLTWEAKVYQRDSTGSWIFREKVTFDSHLRNGTTFIIRNERRVVLRFYIPPVV